MSKETEDLNEGAFAVLGVALLMCAPDIKKLLDYVEDVGAADERKLAASVRKTLFAPPELTYTPPSEDAIKLAKQYEELIEQG
jgi:hypothetical protein